MRFHQFASQHVKEDHAFDLLNDVHHGALGHKKVQQIYNDVKCWFTSITKDQVNLYISFCPVCTKEQPVKKNSKGG